ncbi:Uncharacterised protein [Neisseria subflava]|nr:Uncharacterised protein [Neisseria subflava]
MERLLQFGECPLPNPPPRGRERIAADFVVAGDLKGNLGLQPLITGRLKSKKQPAQPIFLAEPLTRTATPSSLPWERVRERAANRKACIGVVRVLGRLLKFGECPLPSPLPREREQVAADSGVAGRLKKEYPKYQQQEFFRQPLSQGRWNKRCERFFRRPLKPSVRCVPQGTHAVG